MKVTMVTSTFLPNIGGAEVAIFHLSKALIKLGVEVEIIAPCFNKIFSLEVMDPLDGMLKIRRVFLSHKLSFVSLTYALLRFALASDIIHAHFLYPSGFASALYKTLSSKPYVVTMHGVDIIINKSIGYGMRLDPKIDLLTKFVMKDANMLIAPSKLVAKEAVKAGASPSKICVIPNGIDVEKFNSKLETNAARAKLGLDSAEYIVLNVANFRLVKGHDYLMKAIPLILKECPSTIFVFVGEGPEKIRMLQRAKELSILNNVIFTGLVPHELMPFYYASADIFVLSSLSESFSLTALEAMASGKPLVVPPVGALPQILNGFCGFLVDAKNPISFAEAVIRLLKDDSLRKNMGKNARRIVEEKYSLDAVAKKHLALYKDILEGSFR